MKPKITFTEHAIQRALQRGLFKYLDKKLFWEQGEYLDNSRSKIDNVVYCFSERIKKEKKEIRITTMYLFEGI